MQCFDSLLRHRRKALGLLHKPRGIRKMKRFGRIAAVIMCTCALLWFSVDSKAMVLLNVQSATQLKSNWCWAACALMAGRYKVPSTMVNQNSIVQYIKGSSTNNDPGSIYETESATEYVTNNTYTLSSTVIFFPLSFAQIKTSISNLYPVIALVRGSGTGHYYVIRGYDEAYSTQEVYLIDPRDGEHITVSWSDFTSGNWADPRPYKFAVYFNNYNQ